MPGALPGGQGMLGRLYGLQPEAPGRCTGRQKRLLTCHVITPARPLLRAAWLSESGAGGPHGC